MTSQETDMQFNYIKALKRDKDEIEVDYEEIETEKIRTINKKNRT